MEDMNDNLPTEWKRYYMSHSQYFYSAKEETNFKELGIDMDFNIPMRLTQLVCASNMENARQAVKSQLEKSGKFIVTMCRIDYLIVGE